MFHIAVPGITFNVNEYQCLLLLKQTQILLQFWVAGYNANEIYYASTVHVQLHGSYKAIM